jgi:hypothetical protein
MKTFNARELSQLLALDFTIGPNNRFAWQEVNGNYTEIGLKPKVNTFYLQEEDIADNVTFTEFPTLQVLLAYLVTRKKQ